MRTNLLAFVISSEIRKKIVKTLFEYPKRQWTCSSMEEITKIPHATTFRTLKGLHYYGVLKSIRINKKNTIYELVNSPITKELKRVFSLEGSTFKKIAIQLVKKISSKSIYSILLYGSAVKGTTHPKSDIDILVIMKKHNPLLEKKVLDTTAIFSDKINKTISVTIMDIRELQKEKDGRFLKSVKESHEVLYGRKPF